MSLHRPLRRARALPLVAALLVPTGTPLSAQVPPTPDARAIAVATDMKRRGASAADVAGEVMRTHRQSEGQVAVLLAQVGYAPEETATTFVRGLRMEAGRTAATLRVAGYAPDAVAAGLSRAGVVGPEVVAALAEGRFAPADIVRAQRGALRRDAAGTWDDIARSGVLRMDADAFVSAFLKLGLESGRTGPAVFGALRTVSRDAGMDLAATLANARAAYDWTAQEALAWLAGETTAQEALDLLADEYGLSDAQLVAIALQALESGLDRWEQWEVLRALLAGKTNEAGTDIIANMATEGVALDDIWVAALDVYGSADAAADALIGAGIATLADVLALRGVSERVRDVIVFVRARVEGAAGTVGGQIATLLVDVGYPSADVAAALVQEGIWTTKQAASWLVDRVSDVALVAEVLADLVVGGPAEVARLLLDEGLPPDQVWPAVVEATGIDAEQLVQAMADAGAAVPDIVQALVANFSMSLAEAGALVAQLLGG